MGVNSILLFMQHPPLLGALWQPSLFPNKTFVVMTCSRLLKRSAMLSIDPGSTQALMKRREGKLHEQVTVLVRCYYVTMPNACFARVQKQQQSKQFVACTVPPWCLLKKDIQSEAMKRTRMLSVATRWRDTSCRDISNVCQARNAPSRSLLFSSVLPTPVVELPPYHR
uniref:Putative secreted protein n=1 Tax=Amblyomma triste TaxID=251400 RepID=A0A023G1C9_AMBTT